MRLLMHLDQLPPGTSGPVLPTHTMAGGTTTITRPDGTTETRPNITILGLPVIGFSASTFRNGTIGSGSGPSVWANYGGALPLRREWLMR